MKTMAEHHLSGDMMLTISIVAGLAIGGLGGWLLGASMKNIGLGVTVGAIIGLILGLVAGIVFSDKSES